MGVPSLSRGTLARSRTTAEFQSLAVLPPRVSDTANQVICHESAARRPSCITGCFGDAKPVFSTARNAFDCVYICSGIVEVRSL
jgi:hypothetical protein